MAGRRNVLQNGMLSLILIISSSCCSQSVVDAFQSQMGSRRTGTSTSTRSRTPIAKPMPMLMPRNPNPNSYSKTNPNTILVLRSTATETEELTKRRNETSTISSNYDDDYGDFDPTNPEGVICARGVCAVAEDEAPEICYLNEDLNEVVCEPNGENAEAPDLLSLAYIWPRALLLICSVLYGTNFPLGRLMNDAMPASAATSTRMVLASLALSPFLFQLKPELRKTAAVCGTFTAVGYISQSIALVDTPAATVSFLGALVVIVCPALAVLVDNKKMGFRDAPQTWIAAVTCLVGVGVLELGGGDAGTGAAAVGWGDFWSVLQAVGFGTSFFITERMMAKEPSQALPITAMQCAMSAALAGAWALLDGLGVADHAFSFGSPHGAWLLDDAVRSTFTLPGLFLDDAFRNVALAAAFTGFVTTAGNRVGETVALGKLSSSEASVLLATEPLWAAVFASFLLHEQLGLWDGVGGALIVAACVATAIDPKWLRETLGIAAAGGETIGAEPEK